MALSARKQMSGEEYERFALGDRQGQFELYDGRLVEKPWMSVGHGDVMMRLALALGAQVDPNEFSIRITYARLKRSSDSYVVPDVAVMPTAFLLALKEHPGSLDLYVEPLPLVVEVWSPSTGSYDMDRKLPEYRARGDLEIWRVHPYERRVTVWRRQSDGTYAALVFLGGGVDVPSLPGVRIDLDALFAE